jgi:hypothetical protein
MEMRVAGSLIVSEAHGTIRVVAWNKPLVSVDATEYASDETALRQVRVDVKSVPNGVAVSTTGPGPGSLPSASPAMLTWLSAHRRTPTLTSQAMMA